MSVYIKDMEMPKSCYGCCFFRQVDYWNEADEADILSSCKRTGEKTFDDFIKYLPNCPLIPVPDHGRLIDADALMLKIQEYIEEYDGVDEHGWHNLKWCAMKEAEMVINKAPPIIIQSDDKETET